MIITPTTLQNLQTGFSTSYQRGFERTPQFTDAFTMTVPSTTDLETYGWMLDLADLREWVGPRLIRNFVTASYQIRNKKYELTYGVSVDEIEDDRLGLYDMKFELMGYRSKVWKDKLLATALQAGVSTASFDGVNFFATTHPLNPAGNQSNNFTSSALTSANYNTVRTSMIGYTSNNGDNLGIMPNLLVVPPQLEIAAREIVSIPTIAAGGGNPYFGTAQVLVVPALANQATTWYLMDTSSPIKPLVFQVRQAPMFAQQTSPDSDAVFHQDMYFYGVKARGGAGYGLWFNAARSIA